MNEVDPEIREDLELGYLCGDLAIRERAWPQGSRE
jgi:hypothetical protein